MLPRLGSSRLVTTWLALTISASIVGYLDGGWLASWLALEPRRIWHGEVWRLGTWALVELGPMSLIVTCMAIYRLGSELAARWSDRRLHVYMIAIVIGAGVVTSLLALATGNATIWRCGGMAVIDALVIAWARQFPENTLTLWGIITLRGRSLIGAAIALTVVLAVGYGLIEAAPELVACLVAARYPIQRGISSV